MKKYKVKKAFFDKETGEPYSVGDTYQTDNEERVKTLQAGGYIAGGNVSKSDTGKEKTGGGDTPEGAKEPKPDEKKPTEKTDK